MSEDRCCETCKHDLGGGYNNCHVNLEAECAAGAFEAWEPKEMIGSDDDGETGGCDQGIRRP